MRKKQSTISILANYLRCELEAWNALVVFGAVVTLNGDLGVPSGFRFTAAGRPVGGLAQVWG